MDTQFAQVLDQRLGQLKAEIKDLQASIQELFIQIEKKQKQAHHIIQLLGSEGKELEDQELRTFGQIQIADIAYDQLKNSTNKLPIHYRELTNLIQSAGVLIPGKDPAANLLSHMNRDGRFVRVSPGTYGLKEWDLKPYVSTRKPHKSRKKVS